jgi:polysaccharide export outer membrane protein
VKIDPRIVPELEQARFTAFLAALATCFLGAGFANAQAVSTPLVDAAQAPQTMPAPMAPAAAPAPLAPAAVAAPAPLMPAPVAAPAPLMPAPAPLMPAPAPLTVTTTPAVAMQSPPPLAAPPVALHMGSDGDYVIGPGDTLEIFVWRNPELSTKIPVRPDGKISTPLVEDIVAVGKTPSTLAREMEAILAKYVRSPNVNVIVSQAISASSQVTVVGQAASPRSIPYRQGLKVMDAVIAAGGMTQFASGNRAKLVRTDARGSRKELRLHLRNLMEKGDLSQNLTLQPGDVIVIPETIL